MRLIDADALMTKMKRYPLYPLVEKYGVIGVIDTEPIVDAVERKHGRWITIQGDMVVCSQCGMHAPQVMTGCLMNRHLEQRRTNFCSNCGAEMERGEANER